MKCREVDFKSVDYKRDLKIFTFRCGAEFRFINSRFDTWMDSSKPKMIEVIKLN